MRIKICGITRVEDGLAAAAAGTDAIGLVFAPSPREVTPGQARRIVAALPPFVAVVGVFVNASPALIRRTAGAVGFSLVQLHGDENRETIARLSPLRVIRAIRVRDAGFADELMRLAHARPAQRPAAVLLDAYSAEARGGTGRRFDWDLVVGAREAGALDGAPPLILAGGLTADNVGRAVRLVRPDAVDVSGGVESDPGIKNAQEIERFIHAARQALRNLPPSGKKVRSKQR